MLESRVQELEYQLGELRTQTASVAASVEHLVKALDTMTTTVDELNNNMRFGRGAVWAGVALLGSFVGTLGFLFHEFVNWVQSSQR